MGLKARLFVLTVGAAAGAYLGVRAHENAKASRAADETVAVEPPVDAPAGLVAEAIIAAPDVTWKKTQTAIGGFVLLAPATFGGILGNVARVPALATIVDGASPAYAVASSDAQWVVAAHVVTASLARSTLADAGAGEDACVSVKGNFVLVGSTCDAVDKLGPYAYRTLPTRAVSANAIWASLTHAALDDVVRRAIDSRRAAVAKFLVDKDTEQRESHGRAPDLADPRPLVAALDGIAADYEAHLTAMTHAEIALDVEDDSMSAKVSLFPPATGAARDWTSALQSGALDPLMASADVTLATVYWRSTADERERAARSASDTISSAIGPRVPPAELAKLSELFGRVAKARGDWSLASITSGATPGVLVRLSASDAPQLGSSIDGIADLARKPAWETWEKDAGIAKMERSPGRLAITTSQGPFQTSWETRGGEVDLAAGVDATAVLAGASPTQRLDGDARAAAFLRDLHADAVWAVVARPLLYASSPRSDAAMIAFAREGDHVVLRARTTGVVVRNLFVSSKGF